MEKVAKYWVVLLLFSVLAFGCKKEDDTPEVPVETHLSIDLNQVPFPNLSDYGFFKDDIKTLTPAIGVNPYTLSSTAFSDYASKERFIYLPEGTVMEYDNDFAVLDFPIGTIIIKNFLFYVDERDPSLGRTIIETRLLVRKEDKWKPYSYKWNDGQTDAARLIIGATVSASTILMNGETKEIPAYVIPREIDCRTCHNLNEEMSPIGPKPSNLNRGFASNPTVNQIADWTEKGILTGIPNTITTIPDYNDSSLDPITRGRAYLDANCAYCHRQGGTANANGLYINWDHEGADINSGIFKIPTNFNAPNLQYDVVPGEPDQSILWYRMTQTTAPAIMPQLGRSINDDAGIEIIRDYILNLE